jgi:uncharacterized protein with HEPN domain
MWKMSRSTIDVLRHTLEECEYLLAQSQQIDMDSFLSDATLRRAFVRSIEIKGEAAKAVPQPFRDKNPAVPWQAIAGMRDRLIHGYFAVDYEIVWDVVQNKVPPLREQLESILAVESE